MSNHSKKTYFIVDGTQNIGKLILSGLLVNFISDLKTKYTEEIATLALTTFVEQLDAANTQVMSYTMERTFKRFGNNGRRS